MNRVALVVSVLTASAFLVSSAACTRTVYVIQNPDGSYSQAVDTDPDTPGLIVEGDLLDVEVITSNDYVLVDGHDDVIYVEIDLHAHEIERVRRPAMNIALVVDRSGSMQGEKMASARAAAHSLVDDMEDGDHVALLSYASDVMVEVASVTLDQRGRAILESAIDRLESAGGTDLAGGLDHGARAVMRSFDPRDLNRVLLLSDGRPTVGVSNPWAIETMAARWYEEGVSVTTMGIGYDYNEDLMSALAIAGGGNYYYVASPGDMERLFEQELHSFGATVVSDLELAIALPPGVQVRDVYGYKYQRRGDEVVVKMNSLASGQKRRLLMAFDVPANHRGPLALTRGTMTYRDAAANRRRSLVLPAARVAYTRDARLHARSYKRPVAEKLEAVQNARLRHAVIKRLDSGDRSGARRLVQQRIQASKRAYETHGGQVLGREVKTLYDFADEVESAPAPASPGYKHMRKDHKSKAMDAYLY